MPRTYFNDNPGGGTGAPVGNTPSLTSGPVYNWNAAYGGIPSVPSPAGTQQGALTGNLGNMSYLGQLGMGVTEQSSAQAMQPLTSALPGLTGGLNTAMGTTQSLLSGQVPADITRNLQRQAAELGGARGMGPMAPATNDSYLQALGLTGLGLQQQGLGNMTSLMGAIPRGPQFNPSSFLTTPQEQQNWQYLSNTLGSAPIPSAAANANIGAFNAGLNRGGGAVAPPSSVLSGMTQLQEPSWQQTHPGLTPGFPNPSPQGYSLPSGFSPDGSVADLGPSGMGQPDYSNPFPGIPDYTSYAPDASMAGYFGDMLDGTDYSSFDQGFDEGYE